MFFAIFAACKKKVKVCIRGLFEIRCYHSSSTHDNPQTTHQEVNLTLKMNCLLPFLIWAGQHVSAAALAVTPIYALITCGHLLILLSIYLLFVYFVITFKSSERGQAKPFCKDIPPVRSNFPWVLRDQRRNNEAQFFIYSLPGSFYFGFDLLYFFMKTLQMFVFLS